MQQKLWVKDFEHHISAATWNTADELVQAGGVKALKEVEKHFWVASVEDAEGTFETETIITPHKIKAFTCECWAQGRRLMCPHIAASLLKIRQFLEQKTEERKVRAEKRATTELSRITVGNVLDKVAPEELADFVQEYARRDRDFALALKTWFAGSVSSAENPFALVLDSVIPKALPDKKMREQDLRRLRQTLDELERQLLAAHQEHNFRTAFQLSATILERICPLVDKLEDTKRQQILRYCEQAFEQLNLLQETQTSPELRESAWNSVFELLSADHFPAEMATPVLLFLNREATDQDKFRRISELFDQVPSPAPVLVLHLFAGALAKKGMPDAVIRLLEEYSEKPGKLRDIISMLAQTGNPEAAYQAGDHFLEKIPFSFGQRRDIEEMLIDIAKKDKKPARHIKLLWRRFLQNGNFDYFEEMKNVAGDGWPAELKSRLNELRKRGDDNMTAIVLAAEGHKAELAQLLEKQDNIGQFQQYENLFLPENRDFVQARYVELLSNYLREHFGRQASAFVRLQLAGLVQKGEPDLAIGVIRELTTRFNDRPSLPDELTELFPKSKRKAILQP